MTEEGLKDVRAGSETGVPAGGLRILLIEDHQDTAESLKMMLELSAHSVQLAFTADAGIELALKTRPQVLLCDIGLPNGRTGYDVATTLRTHNELSDTVFVALTGYGQDEDKSAARRAGFDHHLTKPIDPEDLETLLGRLAKSF